MGVYVRIYVYVYIYVIYVCVYIYTYIYIYIYISSGILYSLKIVITHMKLLVAVMHLQFIRLPFIDIDIDALQ